MGAFGRPVETSPLQHAGELLGSLGQSPGLGIVRVGLQGHSGEILWQQALHVRPEKLRDQHEFEAMVSDICRWRTSLALDLRSYSSAPWSLDSESRAIQPEELLVVLRSVVETHDVFANLEQVQRRAQARLDRDQTLARLGFDQIEAFRLGRLLNAPGERVLVPSGHPLSPRFQSLPRQGPSARKIENVDTPANQFVKFVLARIGSLLGETLAAEIYSHSPLVAWAKRAEASVRRLIANPFFSRISRISKIDLGSPVLQNREGYRSILQAYLMLKAGLSIRWPEVSEAVFGETRDTAQLYEIWCLIQLRHSLAEEFGAELPLDHFECREGRLRVLRGSSAVSPIPVELQGRHYRLQLHYNKLFSPAKAGTQGCLVTHEGSAGTWSKVMKPDYTIALFPHKITTAAAAEAGDLCLVHFDAKYRLKSLGRMLGEEDAALRTYVPDDLDKMHAYVAGINGSAGAYALYPGDRTAFYLRSDRKASVGGIAASPGATDSIGPAIREALNLAVELPPPGA
ncbi:MAG: DUF2357 domain-containing protein [Allosphingosinicella sp.]